jgi:hypothetical protein
MSRGLTPKRIRFVSVSVLVVAAVLLGLTFATARNGLTFFGTELGHDYAAFYIAGKIQNEYGPHRLYDHELQQQLYHELLPRVSREEGLPYANAPFLALAFRPLARLPYAWSYLVWLCVSFSLFAGGVALMLRITDALRGEDKITALLLVLSFEPFLFECWIGGQISTIGFFFLALSIYLLRSQRLIAAGAALAFCLYKPTLLVLLVPMLVVSRQWKTLAGFTAAAVVLTAVSLMAVGADACSDYVWLLRDYIRARIGGDEIFRTWKFVDLVSFFRMLQHGHTSLGLVFIGATAVTWFGWLCRQWRHGSSPLMWAATVTTTLVLNVYVGIYDATLGVLGAGLTVDMLLRRNQFDTVARGLLVLLYLVPWFSQYFARASGVQLYTLVLAGCAIYQTRLFQTSVRYFSDASKPASVCTSAGNS